MFNRIINLSSIPLVIDGDGLFLMNNPPVNSILTPHKGEVKYILGKDELSDQNMLLKLQEYCNDHGTIIIVKGMPTFIISPNNDIMVMLAGNVGMATAGSGDVLAGIIVSLLSQGISNIEACILGVYMHGRAGNIAAEKLSERFMMASDIIAELSSVFSENHIR